EAPGHGGNVRHVSLFFPCGQFNRTLPCKLRIPFRLSFKLFFRLPMKENHSTGGNPLHSAIRREILPVDAVLPRLVDALRAGNAAVLVAPTGAGKTTRVPPALLAAGIAGIAGIGGGGRVLVLEPRRVAARAAARPIARGGGGRLGEEVGYHGPLRP